MDCCLWRVWRVLQVFSADGSPCSVLPSASLFPGLHIQALLETTGGGFLLCFHLDRHQVSCFHWNEEDHLAGPSGLSMTRAETPVGPGLKHTRGTQQARHAAQRWGSFPPRNQTQKFPRERFFRLEAALFLWSQDRSPLGFSQRRS